MVTNAVVYLVLPSPSRLILIAVCKYKRGCYSCQTSQYMSHVIETGSVSSNTEEFPLINHTYAVIILCSTLHNRRRTYV